MSKAFNTASSVGAVALILSGATIAASPTGAFDAWDVTAGVVDVGACPTGFTCATAVTGEGFFQRQISHTASGADYFQTIITDKTATGSPGALSFSDESYVRTGNVTGLADKAMMKEDVVTGTLTETFEGSTELGTGWANADGGGTAKNETKIYQGIIAVDTAADAEDFDAKFWLRQTGDNAATGKFMRISSTVDIQETGVVADASQDFVLVELSGSENSGASDVFLAGSGTVDWNIGDRIKAVWVGQDMADLTDVAQEFGFTAYEDFDSTTNLINQFSLLAGSSAAPVSWDTGVWDTSSTAFDPFNP